MFTLIIPEYALNYLYNGDATGLNDQEIAEINAMLSSLPIGHFGDFEDAPFFSWNNDINSLGATCYEVVYITL